MKSYTSLFKIKFISDIQYRSAALAGITTQFFFGFIFIMVYIAFYQSSSGEDVMKLSNLISYLWLNQALFALIELFSRDNEIMKMIKDGSVAYELCRPQKLYFKWFFRIYAKKLSAVLLRFLPVIIIALLLHSPYNLSVPYSLDSFIVFLIMMVLSSVLVVAIVTIFHILELMLLEASGVVNMVRIVVEVFSGQIVPIPFLPISFITIAKFLPFMYISDVPFRTYSGDISLSLAPMHITLQIVWITILIITGYLLSNKALSKVVVQGG